MGVGVSFFVFIWFLGACFLRDTLFGFRRNRKGNLSKPTLVSKPTSFGFPSFIYPTFSGLDMESPSGTHGFQCLPSWESKAMHTCTQQQQRNRKHRSSTFPLEQQHLDPLSTGTHKKTPPQPLMLDLGLVPSEGPLFTGALFGGWLLGPPFCQEEAVGPCAWGGVWGSRVRFGPSCWLASVLVFISLRS